MQHLQPNTTLQGGKYKIEKVLGQGGFGITYLATQISLNRKVAIKELFIGGSGQAINERRGNMVVVTNSANQASFDQQKEKFKKEAERLANLNHPNLVKVHELFEENGTAYYVMDYIDGESLRTKVNREGALPEDLVLNYLQQLLPALEVAHKKSIWHLDIKPENIMVDKHGHVYLIDFGASKHIEQNNTLTTSLVLAYTKGYCPPELTDLIYENQEDLIDALKEIGPWTDFYALGATIYNLLTDNIPPSSKRIEKNGSNAFTFPSNVSSSTQDLIVWMMEPDREDRPQEVCDIKPEIEYEDDERTIVNIPEKNDVASDLVLENTHSIIDSIKAHILLYGRAKIKNKRYYAVRWVAPILLCYIIEVLISLPLLGPTFDSFDIVYSCCMCFWMALMFACYYNDEFDSEFDDIQKGESTILSTVIFTIVVFVILQIITVFGIFCGLHRSAPIECRGLGDFCKKILDSYINWQ